MSRAWDKEKNLSPRQDSNHPRDMLIISSSQLFTELKIHHLSFFHTFISNNIVNED